MLAIQKNLSNTFYALLSLPSTAMGFALSVQIAALSWILSTRYGLAIEEVGLVWAAGPIAGIFGQIIFGLISDRVWFWGGRRRPFILIGGVLAALMLLALPNIDRIAEGLGAESLLGIAILVALTLDLSINVGFNPTRSIIADVTPEGQARTKGYTWMQTISGTFGVLAYVVGAVFGNYFLIYFGAGLVLLLSLVPPFYIREPRQLQSKAAPIGSHHGAPTDEVLDTGEGDIQQVKSFTFRETMLAIFPLWGFLLYSVYGIIRRAMEAGPPPVSVLIVFGLIILIPPLIALLRKEEGRTAAEAGNIGFQKVLAAHAFTWIGVQTMFIYTFAFLQYRLPELNDAVVGQVINTAFLVLNAVGALLPALVLEPFAARMGRVRVHLLSIFCMAVAYFGLWLFGFSTWAIFALMAVAGIGWAATVSLPFAIMSQKVDQSRMGLYMGLFNLSVVLPQLVASLGIGEYLGAVDNKGVVFLVCGVCLGISALGWTLVKE